MTDEPDGAPLDDSGPDLFGSVFDGFQREARERSLRYDAYVSTGEYVADLRSAYQSLLEVERFERGDLVQWKTFMRENEYPDYGSPAVVLDRLIEGKIRTRIGREQFPPHDLLLGLLDGDQDFVVFSAASARLTRWEPGGKPTRGDLMSTGRPDEDQPA